LNSTKYERIDKEVSRLSLIYAVRQPSNLFALAVTGFILLMAVSSPLVTAARLFSSYAAYAQNATKENLLIANLTANPRLLAQATANTELNSELLSGELAFLMTIITVFAAFYWHKMFFKASPETIRKFREEVPEMLLAKGYDRKDIMEYLEKEE
jgi:hypothetical protein